MSDLNSDFIDYIEFGGNYLHQNKQNEAKFRLDEFDPNTAIPTLIEMGYNPDIINKVNIFFSPSSIEEFILFLSEVNGTIQHKFFPSKLTSAQCFICGLSETNHIKGKKAIEIIKVRESEMTSIANIVNDNNKEEEKKCEICYYLLEKKEIQRNTLPCGHLCCSYCMNEYLKAQLNQYYIAKIKCFHYDCSTILSDDFLLSLIKEQSLKEKFDDMKRRRIVISSSNRKFCPYPNCNGYLEKRGDKYVKCQNGHKICYECLKEWHGRSQCNETITKEFQLWKKNKVVKACPKCKMYVEKYEGCNYLMCIQCGYKWCWLCKGEYTKDHFTSGKCNKYNFIQVEPEPEPQPVPARHVHHHNDNYERCCDCTQCESENEKGLGFGCLRGIRSMRWAGQSYYVILFNNYFMAFFWSVFYINVLSYTDYPFGEIKTHWSMNIVTYFISFFSWVIYQIIFFELLIVGSIVTIVYYPINPIYYLHEQSIYEYDNDMYFERHPIDW